MINNSLIGEKSRSTNLTKIPTIYLKFSLNPYLPISSSIFYENETALLMGSPEGEGKDNEKPQHKVTITPFFLGKYPITQAQYQQIMNTNPSKFQGNELPVEQVSWNDAVEFCLKLSKQTRRDYRLPSEAEWEYACRAGTTTPYYFGENITDKLANFGSNVDKTSPVGQFPANAFSLYDMHGNVWEWCRDDWHDNYQNAPTNGTAWILDKSNKKVARGGSWFYNPDNCPSTIRINTSRGNSAFNIGFRVAYVAFKTI